MNNYAQYLEHFSNLSVAVVGDLMIDRYIFGQATRISPEAPVPIVLVQKENAVPGGAANVARNILSLHSKVAVFGSIGVDNSGKQLQELLQTAGANIDGVIIRSDFPTTEKIRLLADNQQIARIDRENTHALSEKKQEILLQKLENAIANHEIQAIILEDYAKGCLTFSFIEKIIRIAQQYNIFV
ncbi:MAG: PfkB family carbohydrate kinase, partial [Lentisphaeria bacterium]